MQLSPCSGALVEHVLDVHVPAVPKHHHEHPCLAQRPGLRVLQVARVSEIDLCYVPRFGFDWDRYVLRGHANLMPKAPDHSFYGADLAFVLLGFP